MENEDQSEIVGLVGDIEDVKVTDSIEVAGLGDTAKVVDVTEISNNTDELKALIETVKSLSSLDAPNHQKKVLALLICVAEKI